MLVKFHVLCDALLISCWNYDDFALLKVLVSNYLCASLFLLGNHNNSNGGKSFYDSSGTINVQSKKKTYDFLDTTNDWV